MFLNSSLHFLTSWKKKLFHLVLPMKKTVEKKLCVFIIINQDTQKQNIGKNLTMLSKTKRLDPMPSVYK